MSFSLRSTFAMFPRRVAWSSGATRGSTFTIQLPLTSRQVVVSQRTATEAARA